LSWASLSSWLQVVLQKPNDCSWRYSVIFEECIAVSPITVFSFSSAWRGVKAFFARNQHIDFWSVGIRLQA
jgi:hypothetical protein